MTNTLTTNIIRNVYNIGTNSCDAGQSTCAEGYALYFPCLKDITKGQDACFDFYVADYAGKNAYNLALANGELNPDAGKELADLRDVDALSLNLIGAFNCPYGTFSYPDNISSLQTEEYPLMYDLDFGHRTLCHLSFFMIDSENTDSETYYNTKEGDFYSGTKLELTAEDTPTHIFMGWALLDDEEECPEDEWNIISHDRNYRFIIQNDIIILAIYRPRKTYRIISDTNTELTVYGIKYDGHHYTVGNRPNDIIIDGQDKDGHDVVFSVLEGYHMVVTAYPGEDQIGPTPKKSYKFISWGDGVKDRCRIFTVGTDTGFFEEKGSNYIMLLAKSDGPYLYDIDNSYVDIIPAPDVFDEEGIHIFYYDDDDIIHNYDLEGFDSDGFPEISIRDYYGDGQYVISTEEAYQKFISEDGYLFLHFGNIELTSLGVEDGIKVVIEAKADDYCELRVTVNDTTAQIIVSQDEFKSYEILFRKCNKSNINITAYGDCLIDRIEVRKEEIIDKGKAQLCLPSEVTENLPSGPLSVNGAIMVNGKSYGLATTQIGTVNKLPKIMLNI